jgi:hypothetical protein
MRDEGWYVEKCKMPTIYYPTSITRPHLYLYNVAINIKEKIFGRKEVEFIPELYSHLKSRSLMVPRDAIQANQLRALAIQILKQKEINFSRLEGALMGSISLAMIPDDDEVTGLGIINSKPAQYRKSLVSGEEEQDILMRWMGRSIAYAAIFGFTMWLVKTFPSTLIRLKNAFINGSYRDWPAQIWNYLIYMLIRGALITSLGAFWKDTLFAHSQLMNKSLENVSLFWIV